MSIKEYSISNLDVRHVVQRLKRDSKLAEVNCVNLDFMRRKLIVQYNSPVETALERLNQIANGIETGVSIQDHIEQDHPKVQYSNTLSLLESCADLTRFLPMSDISGMCSG
jgi:hypothetical protein